MFLFVFFCGFVVVVIVLFYFIYLFIYYFYFHLFIYLFIYFFLGGGHVIPDNEILCIFFVNSENEGTNI